MALRSTRISLTVMFVAVSFRKISAMPYRGHVVTTNNHERNCAAAGITL